MKSKRSLLLNFNRQSGFTVVELLIAGVLGLVLLAGVGQLFLGSSATFRMQRQVADVQDSGRFALSFLKDEIESAGWFDGSTRPPSSLTPADPTEFVAIGLDGGGNDNDEITVRYEGKSDCNGNAVGTVINRYFVQDRQLMCAGNGGAPQPLVANVDSFQVLYGWDDDSPPEANAVDQCLDRAADQYIDAQTLLDKLALIPQLDANRVVSVRIALLIGGEVNRSIPHANRSYRVADRTIEYDDQILRRVFSLTAALRNINSGPRCPEES